MMFSKKHFICAAGLLFSVIVEAKHKVVETNKIQVIFNAADPSMSSFVMNSGFVGNVDVTCPTCPPTTNPTESTLVCNPFLPRPAGALDYLTGQIYMGGTVSKKQNSYAVDKHGHTLTAQNSIGTWRCIGKTFQCLDLFNMPEDQELLQLVEWDYFFKKDCDDDVNSVYTNGQALSGTFDPANHAVAVFLNGVVNGGTSCCNSDACCGEWSAKIYLSPTEPIMLIKIKFNKPIKIVVHH